MSAYKLTIAGVQRTLDGAFIPFDVGNRQYKEYLDWLAAGNSADPADPERQPDSDLVTAAAKLASDPVFRALVKVLATRFGISVAQLVNEIKAQV